MASSPQTKIVTSYEELITLLKSIPDDIDVRFKTVLGGFQVTWTALSQK